MAAGTATVYSFPLFRGSLSSTADKIPKPILSIRFIPPSIRVSRLRFSAATTTVAPRFPRRVYRVDGLVSDDSATDPEPESDNFEAVASIDLNLPRRSLLVQFTCDLCGERTKKLVNRLAYERGAIFVQCAGCLQHHKLVDNLGLIMEYDFRDKMNRDSETDQV